MLSRLVPVFQAKFGYSLVVLIAGTLKFAWPMPAANTTAITGELVARLQTSGLRNRLTPTVFSSIA